MRNSVNESLVDGVEVGSGEFRYRVVERWPRLPPDIDLVEVAAIATDTQGRAYVFNRGPHPLLVFSVDGEPVSRREEATFARAHGITTGPDDAVYCVDDCDHTVKVFAPDGRLKMTLGISGVQSDTGTTSIDYRTIKHAGPPFNYPTNLAISPSGELYVSDGYGNARVHKFTADGRLLHSWGEPGDGPGQFHVPHGIAVDRQGTVYVADRENNRIQLFTGDGKYLTEWSDLARPCEIFIDPHRTAYVAELGYRAGMWPGTTAPSPDATGGRVSIFDLDGKLLARFGGGENPCAPGDFFAPHDVWVDAQGDLYVSEVVVSCCDKTQANPPKYHCVQKFIRQQE